MKLEDVNIIGSDHVGGLVGLTCNGTVITNSSATGSVSGAYNVGGLVGYLYGGVGDSNFYNEDKTGQDDAGKGVPYRLQR